MILTSDSDFFLVACGKIRAANGKAKLLVNKKFKQFKGLCDMNLVSLKENWNALSYILCWLLTSLVMSSLLLSSRLTWYLD